MIDRLMDALSKVIALTHIQGSLDLRCQMAGSFELDHPQLIPGEAPFHLVLAGCATLLFARRKALELKGGDFVLLPRGIAHTVKGSGDERETTMVLDTSGPLPERRNTVGEADMDLLCGRFMYAPGAADLIMSTLPDVVHISFAEEGHLNFLQSVVAMMREEVKQLSSGALSIVTALSEVLFVLALRSYSKKEGIPPSLLALLGDSRLSHAVLAMTKEPQKPWTVDTLAKQASMSRATFARHFMERGATSPMDLLTTLRMRLASDLLAAGKLSSADIAERVGYQSEAAFAKAFRKKMGLTPAAFRRQG